MKNGNALIVRLLGKNMELSVFEDRVELYKAMCAQIDQHQAAFKLPPDRVRHIDL